MFGRRTILLAAVLAMLAAGCSWIPVLQANPGTDRSTIQILTPSPESQADESGIVNVEVRLASNAIPSTVKASIRSGSTPRDSWDDITDQFVVDQGRATATIQTAEVGISKLRVSVKRRGRSAMRHATTTWSWEPGLATPPGCDALDQAHCLLPFPNDAFTRADKSSDTGRRVDFVTTLENVNGISIDPTEWNRNDGFSPGSAIMALVPGVDVEATGAAPITDIERSLDRDAPVVVIDAETGERHLNWVEIDSNATSPETAVLYVRPGINFEEGRRYIVALRNMRDSSGEIIEPARLFRLYRDRIPTFDEDIEGRRSHMEGLFKTLRRSGVKRGDLHLAWDFTVASELNLAGRMLHIRDDAFDSLDGAAPGFTVTQIDENVDDRIYRRVWGTFEVPKYLTGAGEPGSRFEYGGSTETDALPVRNGNYIARFVCNIPRATTADGNDPVVPARGTVYGHGLLGAYTQANSGSQRSMANESNMVYCGTDFIGMSEEDLVNVVGILQNFSNFPTLADRAQQGILNFLFLARLLKDPNGFASHEAFQAGAENTPVLVPNEVYYEGISQGGIMGGAATAVSTEWTSASLGVPGMNYSTLLRRSVDFDVYAAIMNPFYPDEIDRSVGLSLIQMLWDRGEANGYAHHMTDDPYPGTPPHRVLLHEAFGDHQVANVTTEVEARTIGAYLVSPALAPGRHSDVDPFYGIPIVPSYPFDGSALVVWDSGNPHPPIANVPPRPPDYGRDPHSEPREEVTARFQKSEFMKPGGFLIDVCGGAPCLAPHE